MDQRGPAAEGEIAEAEYLLRRQGVPWILCSRRTRAEIEPLRRRLQHAHPFMTERGGGLFIPDGYFNFHLEGAARLGRYFCVPFARSHAEAATALSEMAGELDIQVAGLSELSAREVARNAGISQEEAERQKRREFGELFFFAGETERAANRLRGAAAERGWEIDEGRPFWEIRGSRPAGNQTPVKYLMNLYRRWSGGRMRSVGVGRVSKDAYLLGSTDVAYLLREEGGGGGNCGGVGQIAGGHWIEKAGAAGWHEAVRKALQER